MFYCSVLLFPFLFLFFTFSSFYHFSRFFSIFFPSISFRVHKFLPSSILPLSFPYFSYYYVFIYFLYYLSSLPHHSSCSALSSLPSLCVIPSSSSLSFIPSLHLLSTHSLACHFDYSSVKRETPLRAIIFTVPLPSILLILRLTTTSLEH